jgi:hypothetical protein
VAVQQFINKDLPEIEKSTNLEFFSIKPLSIRGEIIMN